MKRSRRLMGLLMTGILAGSFFAGCAGTEQRRATGEYLDDQSINARVKASLVQDDEVAGFDVSTTTFDGVVQLSGFVDTAAQQERAAEVARRVDGVQEVVNNITVNPRASEFGTPRDADDPEVDVEPHPQAPPPPPQQ